MSYEQIEIIFGLDSICTKKLRTSAYLASRPFVQMLWMPCGNRRLSLRVGKGYPISKRSPLKPNPMFPHMFIVSTNYQGIYDIVTFNSVYEI